MLYIGQPIRMIPSGELRIYLGVDMNSGSTKGSTSTLKGNGELELVDSFTDIVKNPNRKWTYSHISDQDGKLVYKIFSEGGFGHFGCIKDFEGYEHLKNEMVEYLATLESQYGENTGGN